MLRQNLLACLIVLPIALCVWLAWPGLQGPLVFDDLSNLAPLDASSSSAYTEFIIGNQSGAVNRVVSMASFAANHWFDNQFDAFSLKTTNLVLHIFWGCVIFWISRRLLLQNFASETASASAIAITSLWLIQPLNLGLSFYAVQRMAQLSCLFVLLGMAFYIQWRIDRTAGKASIFKIWIAVMCYPLAVFSKENGFIFNLFHSESFSRE